MALTDLHSYAVIMAGGGGTRLWPISRKSKPKQFQLLFGDESLLQTMYELLSHFFPAERIFVQSSAEYLDLIKEQLPNLSDNQIILEPETRDTAPAFAFAAATIASRDPDAILGIFYSDNVVQPDSKPAFYDALEKGFSAVKQFPSRLAMIGVRPLYPHTGLGYIELGPEEHIAGNPVAVFNINSFVEKPELHRAGQLAASSNHLWNTGYKIIYAQNLLRLLSASDARFADTLPALVSAIECDNREEIGFVFSRLPRQSFEYLVSEKVKDALVVAAEMEWSDLGDWDIIHRLLTHQQQEGLHASGRVVKLDCENTLIISQERPIVAIGVKGLVVIETKDAILVMSKERSQDIKMVLNEIQRYEPGLL